MYRTYRFRMYPDEAQKIRIAKTLGCCRFIYNYFLNECKEQGYRNTSAMCGDFELLYQKYPFLQEEDNCSLKNSVFHLQDGFKNYFARRSNYPSFKSKFSKQSYKISSNQNNYFEGLSPNIEVDLVRQQIKLPRLGFVRIRGYSHLDGVRGHIVNATVVKEPTGKYYVSVLVREYGFLVEKVVPKTIVGIDLGVKDLIITSDGEKFSNPKEFMQREKQLKRLQKKLSRQVKGSKNYAKTCRKIAVIHSRIRSGRKQNIIDAVNKIVEENDIVISEKLQVMQMNRKNSLAKYILDASFYQICTMLRWKCEKTGKYYYQVAPFYASSKICNHCGFKTNQTKNLGIRNWECRRCGSANDRDINASINVMMEGLRMHYQNK